MEGKPEKSKEATTIQQFKLVLNTEPLINLNALKKLAWQGVPQNLRPKVWKHLLGYLPSDAKRDNYRSYVETHFVNLDSIETTHNDKQIFRCFQLDAPRMQASLPLFQHDIIQQVMIRVAWIWYIKSSAEKNQNMHTSTPMFLTTPLIPLLLQDYVENIDYNTFEVPKNFKENFGRDQRLNFEADVYWCLCSIMEKILQNLSFERTHMEVPFDKMKEILKKSDPSLIDHFEKLDLDFKVFAYGWIYPFLLFDLPLKSAIRLFDTYLADEQGFGVLHCYVCCAILERKSQKLKDMDFNETIFFLNKEITELSEEEIHNIIQDAGKQRARYGDTKGSLLLQKLV